MCAISGIQLAASIARPQPFTGHSTYTTSSEARSPPKNSFPQSIVGSSTDMTDPLSLQSAYNTNYVGGVVTLSDNLITDFTERLAVGELAVL